MQETHGYEQNCGAGILLVCPPTKRILLGLRSAGGDEPNTWCNFGGGVQTGETPLKGAIRENLEECEVYPHNLIECPLYVNELPDGYKYYNYIGIVDNEPKPVINHEHDDYNWFRISELSDIQLHSKFGEQLMKPEIIQVVQKYLNGEAEI